MWLKIKQWLWAAKRRRYEKHRTKWRRANPIKDVK